ncbi:MAG: hypothetical protein WC251_05210 [Candidatus Izemoplasmatales bacterium]|jgi:hypothetical protein|nr:hypothetical protein [Candidatus Izemoplasmatales bacterium]
MPWWGYVLIGLGVIVIAVLKLKVFGHIQKQKAKKNEEKAKVMDEED